MTVTVQNVCDFPITLGPDGVLHQDLWFDAMFRGVAQQTFAGTAIDRLGGPLVLQPRGVIQQNVRLDQGPLVADAAGESRSRRCRSSRDCGRIRTALTASAPADRSCTMLRQHRADRVSASTALPACSNVLQRGDNGEKIRAIDLTSAVTGVLLQQANNDQAKQAAIQAAEAIRDVQRDPSPSVAAWAGGDWCLRLAEADRPAAVQRLINDPSWQSRMVGLAVTGASCRWTCESLWRNRWPTATPIPSSVATPPPRWRSLTPNPPPSRRARPTTAPATDRR